MGETKSIVETILKLKVVGYFLLLWGATFLLWGLADLSYYAFNFSTATGTAGDLLQTILYLLGDITYLSAGIALIFLSSKVLNAKS